MTVYKLFVAILLVPLVFMMLSCGNNDGGDAVSSASYIRTQLLGEKGTITQAHSVITDSNGSVYVVGATTGNLDGNALSGYSDIFVSKFDAEGTKIYTKLFGYAGTVSVAYAITRDIKDNVYVVGYTDGSLNDSSLTGSQDAFIIKLNSEGIVQFTKQIGVIGKETRAYSVATDTEDNIYMAGYTTGDLDGIQRTGIKNDFVAKLDSMGNALFVLQHDVALDTIGQAVAIDSKSNIYVAGKTVGNMDGNSLNGNVDAYLTKYDSAGKRLFTKLIGGPGNWTWGYSLAVDSKDNVYFLGVDDGTLGEANWVHNMKHVFVAKYDEAGDELFTNYIGHPDFYTVSESLVIDSDDNVYVAGSAAGVLSQNPVNGGPDVFMAKYDSAGNFLYINQFGSEHGATYCKSITIDASNHVHVAGFTDGGLNGIELAGDIDAYIQTFERF